MNNKELEPWQKAPVTIIIEAINHTKKQNEEDNLIAFLLLDVGAEMLLKTYLSLPKKITGATTSDDERFNIIRRGFHDVVKGVKDSRQGIKDKDLARILFFHGVRNKLYHQGNGLAVPVAHLAEYIEVLKALFNQLLKIDLDEYLSDTRMTKEDAILIVDLKNQVTDTLNKSRTLRENLETSCNLVIEVISPVLLLPSYVRKFSALSEKAFSEDSYSQIGNDVHAYKALPRETAARAEITEWFQKLTIPLISSSKYYDELVQPVKAGKKHQIAALSQTLGVKSVEVEIQMVSNLFSVIYDDYFDLKSFYYNIVEIIIFDDVYFNEELGFMTFHAKDHYPKLHDESDLEYWRSRLNSCKVQNQQLNDYIKRIEGWLIHKL